MTRATGRPRSAMLAAGLATTLVLAAGCTPEGDTGTEDQATHTRDDGTTAAPPSDPEALTSLVASAATEPVVLDAPEAAGLSAQASGQFFDRAPVVVLAGEQDQLRAASAALSLGVPVLVDGPEVADELERLGTEVALVVGDVTDPGVDVVVAQDEDRLRELAGLQGDPVAVSEDEQVAALAEAEPGELLSGDGATEIATEGDAASSTADTAGSTAAAGEPLESDLDELPLTEPPEQVPGVTVLATGDAAETAAVATARAAGARVVVSPEPDPRASTESVQALADGEPGAVVALGDGTDAETLGWQARAAASGVELPGGGQLTLPGKTYVALYGTPSTPSLGVLGEQAPEETIARAQEHAAWFESLTDQPVVPTLEIIATVASADAGADGNYSNELPVEELEPLVDLAGEHGIYVVLDLQPGRTDFLTQAKLYEDLLRRPHVGLALDPEWRLGPDERHLVQIGSVGIDEVNEVVTWLADLTRDEGLPQKMLVLHQFRISMIGDTDQVDRSRSELAVVLHVDGQGGQLDKQATWSALHQNAPSIDYWGWKNFYDEDVPAPLTPEETMSQVDPVPDFITYQ
ncbi:hypothetical protein ACI3EY_04585 [Ornithinimicrobium sp. LYQ92]|uniref:hypothetical protein n=1 Tax=Serinicoccus sp. LYQ92 TaxID=3378798 RepID=UPI0038553351